MYLIGLVVHPPYGLHRPTVDHHGVAVGPEVRGQRGLAVPHVRVPGDGRLAAEGWQRWRRKARGGPIGEARFQRRAEALFPLQCIDLPLTPSTLHPWWVRHLRQKRRGLRTTDLR